LKEAPSPSQIEGAEPRFHASKDFISVYANHVYFAGTTIFDMRIWFGEVQGIEESELVVESRVSVTMPIGVAKIFALGLDANLRKFESQRGTINLPEIAMREIKVADVSAAVVQPETEKSTEKK